MSALNMFFSGITVLLMMYLVLLLIRVLSTWFAGPSQPGFIAFLARFTDPYLNLFRGMRFLRFQYLDLSPVAALILLQVLITITTRISLERSIWFGLILYLVIEQVGQALGFLFIFFGVLALVRLIAILAKASSIGRVWSTLDHILQPMVYPIAGFLSPRRVLPYGTGLGFFIGLMAAGWFLSTWGFAQLAWLARSIPF
jgi:YggT family protein